MVEESIHIKFYDKGSGNKILELAGKVYEVHISEDYSKTVGSEVVKPL